jgi:uncharacterized membrane protein
MIACPVAVVLLSSVGCSPAPPTNDGVGIPDVDDVALTYENFGASFFETYCLRCHSASLVTPEERSNAPFGINYDTLEDVRALADRIRARAGVSNTMPPMFLSVPRPSQAERDQLVAWIDAGTPSDTDAE